MIRIPQRHRQMDRQTGDTTYHSSRDDNCVTNKSYVASDWRER